LGISFDKIKIIEDFSPSEIVERVGLYYYIFMSQLTTVLIPAILFLFVYKRKILYSNIGFALPKRNSYFTYAIFLLFLSYPLIQLSQDLNSKMFFANWLSKESEMISGITLKILKMDSFGELLRNIFLVALLPSIGEELFFRAGIQKELSTYFSNKDIAIILTAVIFSAFHLEFDGFLPRFFLGLILGYVYYWSSSIWVSIAVHFINNSLLIITAYFTTENLEDLVNTQTTEAIPTYILLMSLLSVFVIRYHMYQMFKEDNFIVEKKEKTDD
jgi:membrane protease YdiL (CAAX protease family)